ncbi:class I SAM-dependent methyltransferase [filamentous cyanobacterium CCP5]|nr:class I SAM-dependent methyltransferase [filamentous cyanobacterium CCP5]
MANFTFQPTLIDYTQQRSAGLYKRFFAWMMAQNVPQYEAFMEPHKRSLFSQLHGTVLEIGPGAGVNLPFYPADIHWIGIEPNPHMAPYLEQKAAGLAFQLELRIGTAEQLPVADASVDAVVSTLVLCSVEDVAATLQEVLRVLKPGGRFYFIEHVAAPQQTRLRTAQDWLSPVSQALGDGCRPNRETWTLLEQAGFERVEYDRLQAPMPLPLASPHIIGIAQKAA